MRMFSALRIALLGALLALPVLTLAPAAEASSRIVTGRNLYDACKVLSEWHLNPVGQTPIRARRCRQYIINYFNVIHYQHTNDMARKVFGTTTQDPFSCLDLNGPRSYDQLAARIVHTAEWHPDLMDQGAAKLMDRTFLDSPPCTDSAE